MSFPPPNPAPWGNVPENIFIVIMYNYLENLIAPYHKGAVCLQSVSYKWLARKYGIPVNNAKQLLFMFFEQNKTTTKVFSVRHLLKTLAVRVML